MVAAIFMVAGIGCKLYGLTSPAAPESNSQSTSTSPGATGSPLFRSLAPVNPSGQTGSSTDVPGDISSNSEGDFSFSADDWSAVLFPLGFSFFVGFAMGFAARQFLRISLMMVGIAVFGLFGLEYLGLIDVNWSGMEQHYHTAVDWLGAQTESFRQFVTGRLPSAGSLAGGLYVGFRRK